MKILTRSVRNALQRNVQRLKIWNTRTVQSVSQRNSVKLNKAIQKKGEKPSPRVETGRSKTTSQVTVKQQHFQDAPESGEAYTAEEFNGGTSSTKRVYDCEACKFRTQFKSEWKRHAKSMLHRQNVVMAAGAAYEPAAKRPNFCRACQVQFDTPEDLFGHRLTDEHKDAVEMERKASYCHVCRKQFTSANQLREHIEGRVHKEALQAKRDFWRNGR
mmetsp:Transcript_9787/g.17243  ORF Transcript_9787/g.17243 Transcript_9787/m.17243 type:complete len:216 (+) Transcript_9787:603-1250(+)